MTRSSPPRSRGAPVVLSVAGGQEGEVPVPRAGVAVTGDVPPGLIATPPRWSTCRS
jgi:hypothetical protein